MNRCGNPATAVDECLAAEGIDPLNGCVAQKPAELHGLSDGYEARAMVDENGRIFFKQRSDPTKADTDGDGLDDYLEDAIESDPLCADTDGDGLSDSLEWNTVGSDLWSADTDGDGHSDYEEHRDSDYDPLVYEERYGPMEMGREFLLGALFGEWGAEEHDNVFSLGGWIASGVIILGDVRDIAATISRGDLVGTGLNLAALLPGYGDAAKVSVIVGTFVGKHPELLKPAMVLLVGIAPHVDNAAEAIKAIRKAHGDEAIERLLKNGITEDELKVVFHQRGNLARTLEVTKRSDGKVVWLEEGKLGCAEGKVLGAVEDKGGSGWIHIKNNHVVNKNANNELVNDFAKVFGETYRDEDKIKELIMEGVKYGQKINDGGVYHYVEPNSGRKLLLVIGDNGYIVTGYPLKVK